MNKTDRAYVIQACHMKGLDIIMPSKDDKGILAYAKNRKNPQVVGECVIDAQSWGEAKDQINNYYQREADK